MRRKLWLKGAIIGLTIGIVNHMVYFLFLDKKIFLLDILDIVYSTFCDVFNLGWGEPCGWIYLLTFPFILMIIGLIGGLVIDYIKNAK